MASESTRSEAITASSASMSCGGSVSARPASTTMCAPSPPRTPARGRPLDETDGPAWEGYLSKLSLSSSSSAACSSLLPPVSIGGSRSEEHTSELQSRGHLVCRLLLEKKNTL